ncbi:male sterility protein-domain-containing protein [Mycena latifolia]|nr:male sterility protein-domain-containing protein [Mycena latifolia]
MRSTPTPSSFFRKQTVFLTGGTGGLGGCLLFKLAMKVDTHRIYVLVRGSASQAIARWSETMPNQIDDILGTNKIHLVVGDITERDFGIDPVVLGEMADSVTLVIHAAGNINLNNPLKETVCDNCLPALELAQLASRFDNLGGFVYISSAYANSFLPDGIVEERIYDVGDPEQQLSEILETGSVAQSLPNFIWPYSFAKHLTERLLLSRNPHLPLLIVRPTMIAAAISEPYPYYSPPGSSPVATFLRAYMEAPDSGVVHVSPRHPAGSNVVDEIPVDVVANLILLHVMHGKTGIVHAGAQSYVPRSLSQLLEDVRSYLPRKAGTPALQVHYVTDTRIKQSYYARVWRVAGRDWHFSNAASKALAGLEGPLSIAMKDHDAAEFMATRTRFIAEEVTRARSKL